jgi:hypothetical protein
MITYYDNPIPGFGVSFKNLVIDQAFFLARQIEVATIQEIQDRLTEVYLTMERPSLLRSVYLVHYFLILVAIILAQMAVFALIAFCYVANTFVFVFGQLLIHFLDLYSPPFDSATIAILFVQFVFLLLSFVYGVLKIPWMVSSVSSAGNRWGVR